MSENFYVDIFIDKSCDIALR
ncbi:hypothetical protein SPHINGOAX6_50225 [Sphingomonas sp. AX6]|nr:hypothetical protein SPHINGOAX6_50225 [Sphingomonas sp. AX6]